MGHVLPDGAAAAARPPAGTLMQFARAACTACFEALSLLGGRAGGRARFGTSRRSASATRFVRPRRSSCSAQTSACCSTNGSFSSASAWAGHVGHVAAALRHLAAGEVERAEELGRLHQVVLDVDAAPAVAVERAGEQPPVGVFLLAERLHARAEQRRIEPAGRRQDRSRESPRPPSAAPDSAAAAGSADRVPARRPAG